MRNLGKLLVVGLAACTSTDTTSPDPIAATGDQFTVTKLVTDAKDADLVNPWGIVAGEAGFWIADNGTGKVSIYDGDGNAVKTDEYVSGRFHLNAPITGVVANLSKNFVVSEHGTCAPAEFLFASECGDIIGVTGDVSRTHGIVAVSDKTAVFKGIAIAGDLLLAADFHNGRIDVFDSAFHDADPSHTMFRDPDMLAGFAPFNLRVIGDKVYVAFAKQDATRHDEVAGPGLGAIDVFDMAGKLVMRFATGGTLNAPWGLAMAPATFGSMGGALLVGNFGDGHITAFDVASGKSMGELMTADGAIAIDGLWGITAGDGKDAGSADTLYFVAGPDDEMHGMFGRIMMSR